MNEVMSDYYVEQTQELLNSEVMSDYTVEQIQERLDSVVAKRAALERALEDAIENERLAMLAEIRALYEDAGYTAEAVADMLVPKKAPKTTKRAGTGRGGPRPMFALNTDQSKVYRRGVLPEWMKDAMRAKGYDPEKPDDRKSFRSAHMTEVAAE